MQKLFFRYLAFLPIIFLAFSGCVYADEVSTSAKAAVVTEAVSGRVLYNQGGEWELPMASTTKIMTAYVVLKHAENLDEVVTVSENAAMTEGSSMYLEKGENITIENLLYGLMLLSGNDAAVALAENIGGSVDGFVKMMNDEAEDMGLSHTHFDNPNGLPSDTHYTTALELNKITSHAMEYEKFREIVKTKTKSLPWQGKDYNREMTNHNKLLGTLDGCVGVKTGYTVAAGRCLVSAVERDGMTLICTTLCDPNDWEDHKALHNAMFDKYTLSEIVSENEVIDKIVLAGGLFGYSGISPSKTYKFPICQSDDIKVDTKLDENISFPIYSGDRAGGGIVYVNGEKYGEFDLVANNDISLNNKGDGIIDEIKENIKYVFSYWMSLIK